MRHATTPTGHCYAHRPEGPPESAERFLEPAQLVQIDDPEGIRKQLIVIAQQMLIGTLDKSVAVEASKILAQALRHRPPQAKVTRKYGPRGIQVSETRLASEDPNARLRSKVADESERIRLESSLERIERSKA